jgi:hypothetical protein
MFRGNASALAPDMLTVSYPSDLLLVICFACLYSLARLEAALNVQYAERNENKVYQYRWALRHPVVKEAIIKAMGNRFSSR